MTTPDYLIRFSRLPAWARAALQEKDAEIERLTLLIDGDPRPAIAVRSPYRDPQPVAWDWADEIRFAVQGTSADPDAWISFRRREEGVIEVLASGTLLVLPNTSNGVRLEVR